MDQSINAYCCCLWNLVFFPYLRCHHNMPVPCSIHVLVHHARPQGGLSPPQSHPVSPWLTIVMLVHVIIMFVKIERIVHLHSGLHDMLTVQPHMEGRFVFKCWWDSFSNEGRYVNFLHKKWIMSIMKPTHPELYCTLKCHVKRAWFFIAFFLFLIHTFWDLLQAS